MISLRELLTDTAYRAYTYSYPHKTAYRPLEPPRGLDDVWRNEDKSALFLYVHVPFCEMRCGFCNLFTVARPESSLDARYMQALTAQAERVAEQVGSASYARLAIGGGTPTFLEPADLSRIFDLVESVFGAQPRSIPVSCEMSPETVTREKLAVLRERGVDRASMGVQSFFEEETRALGRPQQRETAIAAVRAMRDEGFPVVNLDLIYGIAGQTPASFLASLDHALELAPEELYLYPLYVRPLTGLGRRRKEREREDHRLELYRAGRDRLLSRGYTQVSMRYFRAPHAPSLGGPVYRCQEDGMVGLGPGARSYTQALHYSSEYAVSRKGVLGILHDYLERDPASFAKADYGIELHLDEQRRRFLIQSLLTRDGLSIDDYQQRFQSQPQEHYPHLSELLELGLVREDAGRWLPTQAGLEVSDVIGPWLFSSAVHESMEAYALR